MGRILWCATDNTVWGSGIDLQILLGRRRFWQPFSFSKITVNAVLNFAVFTFVIILKANSNRSSLDSILGRNTYGTSRLNILKYEFGCIWTYALNSFLGGMVIVSNRSLYSVRSDISEVKTGLGYIWCTEKI